MRAAVDRPLSPRDRQVVELVGRFRLMTAEQIRSVAFGGLASKTPADRTLARLTAAGYLARLARFVGGFGGGSGQFVYQLGRAGWRLTGKGGGYRPLRVVDVHTLTITECYVQLAALEQAGRLTVVGFTPEPASHLTVAGVPLTPDAYAEVGDPVRRLKYRYWLEIDRDTENADTLRGKCVRYWKAYKAWEEDVFPYVVFVVPDERRRREVERVIAGGPAEAQILFQVYPLEILAEVIHRNM
jgi:hypothetical protein